MPGYALALLCVSLEVCDDVIRFVKRLPVDKQAGDLDLSTHVLEGRAVAGVSRDIAEGYLDAPALHIGEHLPAEWATGHDIEFKCLRHAELLSFVGYCCYTQLLDKPTIDVCSG